MDKASPTQNHVYIVAIAAGTPPIPNLLTHSYTTHGTSEGMAAPWPMNYGGRPPARKSQAWARPLPALWLFALLLGCLVLIMPIALAQDDGGPTASPTPGATLSMGDLEVEVEGITPEEGLVGDILGTDVDEEFQQNQHLLDFLIQWDWQRLLRSGSAGGSNDTTDAVSSTAAAPFVMCAEGGRAAVEEMMNDWSLPTSSSSFPSRSLQGGPEQENTTTATEPATTTASASAPLYAQSNLTCYVVQGFALDVLNQTVHMEQIKYSAPLPAILNFARGLFVRISQGRLFATAEACAAGIRVVLSPGICTEEAAVTAFVASVQGDLRTEAFREKLAAAFPFADETVVSEANDISAATALARAGKAAAVSSSSASFSTSHTAKVGPSRRLRQQLRRKQAAPATTKSTPTGRRRGGGAKSKQSSTVL